MKRRGYFFVLIWFFIISSEVLAEDYGSIQIKGSDTMVNLGQAWAEAYMKRVPEAFIAVTGAGSGTGIAALINGTTDIAQSSRAMSPKERDLAEKNGRHVQEVIVGTDAIAVIVHPDNPVEELTIEQLSDIFSGKMADWSGVRGTETSMLVLSRERNSGTHVYFLEEVVRKGNAKGTEEFAPQVLMMPSSQATVQEVADNPAAIGYLGMGYLTDDVRAVGILNNAAGEYVRPSLESVNAGGYPIARPLYFYLPAEPKGIVKSFVDFVLSPDGQAIVLEMDFVPLAGSQAA